MAKSIRVIILIWIISCWIVASLAQNQPEVTQHNGIKGLPGIKGRPGIAGDKGECGCILPPGKKGEKGDPGGDGHDGTPGIPGPNGRPGSVGAKGESCGANYTEEPGLQGPRGPPGPPGIKGDCVCRRSDLPEILPQGNTGQPGPEGPPGAKGVQGKAKVSGLKGKLGRRGKRGNRGRPGYSTVKVFYSMSDLQAYSEQVLDIHTKKRGALEQGTLAVLSEGAEATSLWVYTDRGWIPVT